MEWKEMNRNEKKKEEPIGHLVFEDALMNVQRGKISLNENERVCGNKLLSWHQWKPNARFACDHRKIHD